MSRPRVFGEWDAPATDDGVPIPTPVGSRCLYCRERIVAGDNGAIFGGLAQHRECSLRSVLGGIGHHVDHARYCRSELGPDAGLSYRRSALLVWRWHVEGVAIDEAELATARAT